jgi:thymidylate synthase (FAD)
MTLIEPEVTLEWITPDPISTIERAGRVSYKSEDLITPESGKAFVAKLNRLGHHSVLENATASFRVICDRAIGNEIVRHRLFSFVQESTRYVGYSKQKHGGGNIKFILPEDLNESQRMHIIASYKQAEEAYNKAIALGCTPQQARDLLPLGVKTEIVMCGNFRNWMHFIHLRTDKAAHPKIRVVAAQIQTILRQECPVVFGEAQK